MSFSLYHRSIALVALLSTLITSSPLPQSVPATPATITSANSDSFTVGSNTGALTVAVSTNSSANLTYDDLNATMTSLQSEFTGFNPLATLGQPVNITYGNQTAGIAPVFANGVSPTPYEQSTEIGFRDVLLVLEGLRDWMSGKNLSQELDFSVTRAGTSAGTTITPAGQEVATGFFRDLPGVATNGTANVTIGGTQMTCSPVTSE